jgi:hypothetical protein
MRLLTLPPPAVTSPAPRWKSFIAVTSLEISPHQSRTKSPSSGGKGDEDVVQELDAFIKTTETVLGSGMRLADIVSEEYEGLAMVPPDTRETDQVWFIKGCSCTVVLRDMANESHPTQYKVIGGVYLTDAVKENFEDVERWASSLEEEDEWDSGVLYLC